jgi:3-keto-disaccharide hydrolase
MLRAASVFVICLFFVIGAPGLGAGQGQKVLFEDDFTTLDPGWGLPGEFMRVERNRFVLTPEESQCRWRLYQGDVFEDFDYQVKIRMAKKGGPIALSGVVFWAKNYDNRYDFVVNPAGQFAVTRHTGKKTLSLQSWTDSPAIKKEEGETNLFRVVAKGNQATLYVNGTQVYAFKGFPPPEGSLIGFIGCSPLGHRNVFEISELKVVAP